MPKLLNFYVDDSGTRHPDHAGSTGSSTRDWFALGGVLINEEDESTCRHQYAQFRDKWQIAYPLHSSDIRHAAANFRWLRTANKTEQQKFMQDITKFLTTIPAIGLACVIDRPGYDERYTKKYGRDKWLLCKTAFSIAVERAAKYALSTGRKLNIYIERCNPTDDRKIIGYHTSLKQSGQPFDPQNSQKYGPLNGKQLASVLYDVKLKYKTSPGIQIADLYLWPMCMGGYHKSNKPYALLKKAGKLMDALCPEERTAELGIKYSCFDLVKPQP